MNEGKNLHDGHRARITEKFLENPDTMQEHELLEILLFRYIPRRNTNDIAHRLLQTFGNLENLFNADGKTLTAVEGVGKTVAAGILLTGKLIKTIYGKFTADLPEIFNYATARRDFVDYFRGMRTEKTVILLLDKRNTPIAQLVYEMNSVSKSYLNKTELANAIAINKPTYAIMAHNHPSGIAAPSRNDDIATLKVYELCDLLGVRFNDHIIVAGNDTFSYYYDGRLAELRQKYNSDDYLHGINEKEFQI